MRVSSNELSVAPSPLKNTFPSWLLHSGGDPMPHGPPPGLSPQNKEAITQQPRTRFLFFLDYLFILTQYIYFFVNGFPSVFGFMTCVPFHLPPCFLFLVLQVRSEFSQPWWGLSLRSDSRALYSVCFVYRVCLCVVTVELCTACVLFTGRVSA